MNRRITLYFASGGLGFKNGGHHEDTGLEHGRGQLA